MTWTGKQWKTEIVLIVVSNEVQVTDYQSTHLPFHGPWLIRAKTCYKDTKYTNLV